MTKKTKIKKHGVKNFVTCPNSRLFTNRVFTSIQLCPNFYRKTVRYSISIKEGSEIIGMIRLDRAKVLFVAKELEDPV